MSIQTHPSINSQWGAYSISDPFKLETIPYWASSFKQDIDAVTRTSSQSCFPRLVPILAAGGQVVRTITLESGSVGSVGLVHSWANIYGPAAGAPSTAMVAKAQCIDITSEWAANTPRTFTVAAINGSTAKPFVLESEEVIYIMIGINCTTSVPKLNGLILGSNSGLSPANNGIQLNASYPAPTNNSQNFSGITQDNIIPLVTLQ